MGYRGALIILGLLYVLRMDAAQCPQGQIREKSGCIDLNECEETPKPCGDKAICTNTNGSYYCECIAGYWNPVGPVRFNHTNGQCKDVNECIKTKDICGPMGKCNNTIGNYSCICEQGYTNSTGSCTDIDECNEDICGMNGACNNLNGSYWCKCQSGYTNYGNERTPCSELKCDHFKEHSAPAQSLAGPILSLMRNSCLALTDPNSAGKEKPNGEMLLENFLTATEAVLSSDPVINDMSGLLGAVEDAMRLIGPQLKQNHTNMGTPGIEMKFAVQRGQTPPTGPIQLITEHVSLETDWTTVAGNGTYPGFAFVASASYHNLEKSANQSFEQLTGLERDGVEPSFQIASKVVSIVVSNPSTQHLSNPINLTFRRLEEEKESVHMSYICAYWKVGHDGQEEGGAWSTDGCKKQLSNATHTVCNCNHLSSFAVLMALYPMKHTFGLLLATKIGLSFSLLCLIICILTFKFCRSIQGTRTTIHLHLCVCLFLADFVFLTAISQTKPEGGCRFVAALLHYCFLGVFCWMLLEGVQLYRMVVLVFNATLRPLYLYAFGYGTPLLVVIISAISRPRGYGTDEHCWLDQSLIWSFYGPVCLIIIVNVFFFIVTVWKLAQKFSSLNPDLTKLHKIKAFTATAIAQMCVLGLMWVFGAFLFQEEGTVVVAYMFTILNSLQGALLFIMHCLLSKQVREEYANFLSCVCRQQKKKYSEFSSTNPSSSQSQGSRSGQITGESQM